MSRELFEAFAREAGKGYSRDEVVAAAGSLILNALRQKHERLSAAKDELAGISQDMSAGLARDHYGKDGLRNGLVGVGPGLIRWLRSEGVNLGGET